MDINKVEIVEEISELDWCLKAINAPYAWQKTKGEGIKIVVIDTGADVLHEDFKYNVKAKLNMITKCDNVYDSLGHGTHITGLLVGQKTGVAPDADLHVVKVLDGRGYGTIADVMDGITYAINIGADVLSISLGAPYSIPLILEQRIVQAYEYGITIVSAVGNDGNSRPLYPAKMNEVIGVGGYDENLRRAEFSNGGYDILAPSTNILSTFNNGKYAKMSGTSFASPLVAGSVALILSYCKMNDIVINSRGIRELLGKKLDLQKTFDELDKLIIDLNGDKNKK